MSEYDDLRVGQEGRLWQMIEQRTQAGASVATIDRHIWELFGEKWAIMFTDLAGFSRRTRDFGICHFLQVIHESKKLVMPIVADHNGFLLKAEADSLMVLFRSPASALRCAVAMQKMCVAEDARRVPEEKIMLCLGLGYGDMLRIGEHDVWGKEVNAASKLGEDTAEAYEILATAAMRQATEGVDAVSFASIDQAVAGSAENFRVSY